MEAFAAIAGKESTRLETVHRSETAPARAEAVISSDGHGAWRPAVLTNWPRTRSIQAGWQALDPKNGWMTPRGRAICVLMRHCGRHRRQISVRRGAIQNRDGRPNASSAPRSYRRCVRGLPVYWVRVRASQINRRKIEA